MFFKVLKLRVRREIEELKSIHRIEMQEKEADLRRLKQDLEKTHELKIRETVSLLKLDSEQKIKQLEINAQRDLQRVEQQAAKALLESKEELLKESYDKLSEAMSKLHAEGNVTTKFTQDLALKMFESMPTQKVQTRVITHVPEEK